jgi:enoyl-CoA hydratase
VKVHFEKEGGFGRITLDNPPRNVLDRPDFTDPERLDTFFGDRTLRGVVLRGGGRHFCHGADIDALEEKAEDWRSLEASLNAGREVIEKIAFAPLPIAARIRGGCFGAGMEIALACHFRFAAEGAMFGFPETELGFMPGLGGTVLSHGVAPRGRLVELILSGRLIGAAEALSLGLIDGIFPAGDLKRECLSFLERLTSSRPPYLIRRIMKAIHGSRLLPLSEAMANETKLFSEVAAHRSSSGEGEDA